MKKPKYILIPNWIRGVSYGQLISCYGLDPKDCIDGSNKRNTQGIHNLKDYITLGIRDDYKDWRKEYEK